MTDRQSSLIAAVAMAAMFAVGVAFGIALDHRVLHRRPRPSFSDTGRARAPFMMPPAIPGATRPPEPNAGFGPGAERALDAFARDLALSAEQRAVADSILRHEFEAANAIREETWPRMQAVMADTRQKLDSLLTPMQRERYHTLLVDQEQRFRARDLGRPPFSARQR